jgi:RHS repeat-associated protein
MPMKVVYRTVNGRILGHKAGVASEYLLDPLGSVIGTSNSAGVVSNRTTYWPFGEVRTGGVSSVTPFGFCGGWGYYTDSSGSLYVRARYYRPSLTRWQTVDPLWPDESAFAYVDSFPTYAADPTGQIIVIVVIGIAIGGVISIAADGGSAGDVAKDLACCASQAKVAVGAAQSWCQKHFNQGHKDGTLCNAYQHCMWACLTAQRCGFEAAKKCTDAHEENPPLGLTKCPPYRQVPPNGAPNPKDHKCMDLHNNAVGLGCSSAGSCDTCCTAHAKAGGFEVINPMKPMPPRWKPPKTNCKRLR